MKIRFARHSFNLKAIQDFYEGLVGLEVLGSFQDHESYDGLFLGYPGENWHLEFTTSPDFPDHKADEDDLLVFYVESQAEYDAILQRLEENNTPVHQTKNQYWERNGKCFLDPDGFGIVISDFHLK